MGWGVHGGRLGRGGFQGFLANIRYRLWTAAAKDDDWRLDGIEEERLAKKEED